MENTHSVAYQYTNSWFNDAAKAVWDQLIPQLNPDRILEIGSFEGASSCYLIDKLAQHKDIEIHCIDTWSGGDEHGSDKYEVADMSEVENRFIQNVDMAIGNAVRHVNLVVHKGVSDRKLADLMANDRQGYFDFIYIDGSHQAPDVLLDALLSFRLLRVGGIIAFDDYLWSDPVSHGLDIVKAPKIAIDAFTNIYHKKIRIIEAPLYQLYVEKLSD